MKSAVIWCEDHGDLAFYKREERTDGAGFDAGDWVQFDVSLDSEQRLAVNPRLVAEGLYPELADKLSEAAPVPPRRRREGLLSKRRTAEVIPFGRLRQQRDAREQACAQPA